MITAYICASLALIVKPGPDLMFLFATALSHGRKKAFALMSGQMLGCWLWILALTAGVAAFFSTHPKVVAAIQLVGTAYIAYLAWGGVKDAMLGNGERGTGNREQGAGAPSNYFFHGVFMAATNPLTVLFFMAFLPGFVDAFGASPALGTFLFGTLFCALVPLVDVPLVLATDFSRVRLIESKTSMFVLKWISAAILCAVAALLAYRAVCSALVF